MGKNIFVLLIALAVMLMSAASAQIAVRDYDYLRITASEVNPTESARAGQLVNARIVLKEIHIPPEEAVLNITTEVVAPRIEVRMNETYLQFGISPVSLTLPPEGIGEIDIRVSGTAPKVERLRTIIVLDVKTFVRYKGAEGVVQDEGQLSVKVSDIEIREALLIIEEAQSKLGEAVRKVDLLKAREVDTADLEARIHDAETQVTNAQQLHDKGEIELARTTAELAVNSIDRIILDAEKLTGPPAPSEIRRYLVIAAAVMVALLLIIIIKGRREELG